MPEQSKEKPILFSGPMVRAVLEGRKTQTRRVINPQPEYADLQRHKLVKLEDMPADRQAYFTDQLARKECPFGQPGDRLWVREGLMWIAGNGLFYRADETPVMNYPENLTQNFARNSVPGIFMPRWASRLTLEIANVRVERLNDISESDARAEGTYLATDPDDEGGFVNLWDSINGKKHPWASNPWVWVIKFQRKETA